MSKSEKLIPFLEVISEERVPYSVIDEDGCEVQVMVPNPLKHNDHPEDTNPVVHFNVGNVIKYYDRRYVSPKQPSDGSHLNEIYEMDGFFAESDFPGFDKSPRRSLRVVVRYAKDRKKSENFTTTYYGFYKI